MKFLRQAIRQTWLLLLVALFWGVFSVSTSVQKSLAYKMAPDYVFSAEDLRAKELERDCEARNRVSMRRESCSPSLSFEAWNFEREHIEPAVKTMTELSQGVAVLLLVIAGLRLAWLAGDTALACLRQKLPPGLGGRAAQGMQSAAGGLWPKIQSWRAERQFHRYHRLYQGGLLSEAEFEAKKRELKPKILG